MIHDSETVVKRFFQKIWFFRKFFRKIWTLGIFYDRIYPKSANDSGVKQTERDIRADILKGYACLLVLIGHVMIGLRTSDIFVPSALQTAESFIWTFHIDLFMFLSGYVYTLTGGSTAKGSRIKFILGKLLNLGVPYLVFSALYILVNSVTPGVNNASSAADILFLAVKPVAQYWFLYALLWLFIIWTLLTAFLDSIKATVIVFAVFCVCKYFGVYLGFLDSALNCALAFGLGTCTKSLDVRKIPVAVRLSFVAIHIVFTVVALIYGFYERFFIDDIVTVIGIFSSVCLISVVSEAKPIADFLGFVCKYSFPIYLLHTFFTAAVRIALLRVGITSYAIHFILGTLTGLFAPILAAIVTSRTPYLDFFFYPTRSLKKIRAGKAK